MGNPYGYECPAGDACESPFCLVHAKGEAPAVAEELGDFGTVDVPIPDAEPTPPAPSAEHAELCHVCGLVPEASLEDVRAYVRALQKHASEMREATAELLRALTEQKQSAPPVPPPAPTTPGALE